MMQGIDVRNMSRVFLFKKIGFVDLVINIIKYRISFYNSNLALIPTASKMSSFSGGGQTAMHTKLCMLQVSHVRNVSVFLLEFWDDTQPHTCRNLSQLLDFGLTNNRVSQVD